VQRRTDQEIKIRVKKKRHKQFILVHSFSRTTSSLPCPSNKESSTKSINCTIPIIHTVFTPCKNQDTIWVLPTNFVTPFQATFIFLAFQFEFSIKSYDRLKFFCPKFVLSALPLFYLSFFKAPSTVYKMIRKIQSQFLWGWDHEDRKIAWISWDNVCSPKELEGLGVRDINKFNEALITKWKWRFSCGKRGGMEGCIGV